MASFIEVVTVQNLLRHTIVFLRKTLDGSFFCLAVLASSTKISIAPLIDIENQNRNFRPDNNILDFQKQIELIASKLPLVCCNVYNTFL